jgi:CRISPR-associated endonuclease/helicase Cas3
VCEKVRHRVEVRSGNLLENLQGVVGEIRASQETTLIVCNHVATSQAVWRALCDHYGVTASLLHSRFNTRDRSRIEQEITGPSPPRVLVATQAVEVSLELDYWRGYSEPAPADALGQRFGRINRKGSRQPAPVVVFRQPSAGHLYNENTTQRTVELLAHAGLLTEQCMTTIVDEIYAGGYQGQALDDYTQGLNHPTIARFEQTIVAGTHRPWVEDLIQGEDVQIEVLPLSLRDEYKALIADKRYLEAGMLLVPIRHRQFLAAKFKGMAYYDDTLHEWLTAYPYSSEHGLNLVAAS